MMTLKRIWEAHHRALHKESSQSPNVIDQAMAYLVGCSYTIGDLHVYIFFNDCTMYKFCDRYRDHFKHAIAAEIRHENTVIVAPLDDVFSVRVPAPQTCATCIALLYRVLAETRRTSDGRIEQPSLKNRLIWRNLDGELCKAHDDDARLAGWRP